MPAFPILSNALDGQIYLQMKKHPRLDYETNELKIRPHAEFHASGDKPLFNLDSVPKGFWPLYKGESLDLWQPDTGKYYGGIDPAVVVPFLFEKRKNQYRMTSSLFSLFPKAWIEKENTLPIRHERIAFRVVTNRTNSRTVIAALVPPEVGLTHGAPYLMFPTGNNEDIAYTLGVLSSIPLDWQARRTVEINLTYHILNGFSYPRPAKENVLRRRIVSIVVRLTSIDNRFSSWAKFFKVKVLAIDPREKDELIAELDALVSILYGLSETQVEYVFNNFHRGADLSNRLSRVKFFFREWEKKYD